MSILLLIAGICLLILGAEILVRGASRLAAAAGIAPVVVGLTVVAFGTSAPELAVSIGASLGGRGDIAVGNVVGSNIFNVLFILGASALVAPLVVTRQLIRLDVPVMVGVSVAAFLMGLDDAFGRFDGVLLVFGLVVYVGFLGLLARRAKNAAGPIEMEAPVSSSWVRDALFVAGGLAMLVVGSRWFVDSAVAIAQLLGVSQVVIGLTVVAAGTSMPEVVTSLVASVRGERDIAVGNVVGSNIFNVLGVLGFAAFVSTDGLEINPSLRSFDLPVMIAVAFACFPIFFSGGRISRWEGFLLLSYYAAYTTYLLLAAAQHSALAGFSFVMVYFTIPLTAVTLLVIALHTARRASR